MAVHISKGVRTLIHVTLQRSKIVDRVVGGGALPLVLYCMTFSLVDSDTSGWSYFS